MKNIVIPSFVDLEKERLWIEKEIEAIGNDMIRTMVEKAAKQRAYAYTPYSGYNVGVAILTDTGQIFIGANAERVSYSETDHAEQAAITAAVNAGAAQKSRKFLRALAVSHTDASAPCGHCRQIIVEHCEDCLIIVADEKQTIRYISSINILLPDKFTPSALGK